MWAVVKVKGETGEELLARDWFNFLKKRKQIIQLSRKNFWAHATYEEQYLFFCQLFGLTPS